MKDNYCSDCEHCTKLGFPSVEHYYCYLRYGELKHLNAKEQAKAFFTCPDFVYPLECPFELELVVNG